MPIQRHLLGTIPPSKKAKTRRIDYSNLKVEQTGPPSDRVHITEKWLFIQALQPGDSFLVERAAAGPLVTAINKIHGKNAGAKRQVDLDYARVYRVH